MMVLRSFETSVCLQVDMAQRSNAPESSAKQLFETHI